MTIKKSVFSLEPLEGNELSFSEQSENALVANHFTESRLIVRRVGGCRREEFRFNSSERRQVVDRRKKNSTWEKGYDI